MSCSFICAEGGWHRPYRTATSSSWSSQYRSPCSRVANSADGCVGAGLGWRAERCRARVGMHRGGAGRPSPSSRRCQCATCLPTAPAGPGLHPAPAQPSAHQGRTVPRPRPLPPSAAPPTAAPLPGCRSTLLSPQAPRQLWQRHVTPENPPGCPACWAAAWQPAARPSLEARSGGPLAAALRAPPAAGGWRGRRPSPPSPRRAGPDRCVWG